MKRLVVGLACLSVLAFAAPARAQTTHGLGDAAFSPDGSHLAFHVQGRPKTGLLVLEVGTGKAYRLEMAAPHVEARDIGWSPTGDKLLFVSLDPTGAVMRDSYILGGWGTHIWSVDFGDAAHSAKVLAKTAGARWPALSADGGKLAYFKPVPLPREEPPNRIMDPKAFAVFETDLATGEAARVAKSQYATPFELFYETADTWLFAAAEPQYVTNFSGSVFWSSTRPSAPPGKGSFDQLSEGVKSFRMERGEVLPDYPDFRQPFPPVGVAPPKSRLAGQTQDGRPILYGAPGPENTTGNQVRNSLSWYVPGVSRVEMKEGYMTFAADGTRQVYRPPAWPAGYNAFTGGMAVDGGLKRFAAIMTKVDPKTGTQSPSRLFLYEGDALKREIDVPELASGAEIIVVSE